ncbi:MAG: 23S rRNA (guanosine(2251)-2'-O)-methyltransferase RlmB [Candidatus Omnitrophica bacterium]|nr:23S rRNA (guanosine(2251)-2'-O)-methyltransferase RlmB [Candidatus Omnitrophota bacterium]
MRLYGKNPVFERVKTDPGSIKKLYLQKKVDLSELVKAIKAAGMQFESVDKEWFHKECGGIHSQGVLAEVDEYQYSSYDEVMDDCLSGKAVPVFLDGITDPQNLGAIIRTLACMGGFSVVIPAHDSAEVNETVLRVASGGENYIKIAEVTNIATALGKLKGRGVTIAGAIPGGQNISGAEFNFPIAVVIGSEGRGIRPGVEKHLDLELELPMDGAPLSYNASVAAALFCYEVRRLRAKG